MKRLLVVILTLVTIVTCNVQNHELYDLKTPLESRSISDDSSTATFWYEPIPSAPLHKIPDAAERIKDLDEFHNSIRK